MWAAGLVGVKADPLVYLTVEQKVLGWGVKSVVLMV